ncbi:MAG: hypothetical protein ACRC1P_11340 [Cellulosilyticaceae bacterium]
MELGVKKQRKLDKSNFNYYLNCGIAFCILLVFWLVPPIEPITTIGMRIIGILISVIYLWSTVDTI